MKLQEAHAKTRARGKAGTLKPMLHRAGSALKRQNGSSPNSPMESGGLLENRADEDLQTEVCGFYSNRTLRHRDAAFDGGVPLAQLVLQAVICG